MHSTWQTPPTANQMQPDPHRLMTTANATAPRAMTPTTPQPTQPTAIAHALPMTQTQTTVTTPPSQPPDKTASKVRRRAKAEIRATLWSWAKEHPTATITEALRNPLIRAAGLIQCENSRHTCEADAVQGCEFGFRCQKHHDLHITRMERGESALHTHSNVVSEVLRKKHERYLDMYNHKKTAREKRGDGTPQDDDHVSCPPQLLAQFGASLPRQSKQQFSSAWELWKRNKSLASADVLLQILNDIFDLDYVSQAWILEDGALFNSASPPAHSSHHLQHTTTSDANTSFALEIASIPNVHHSQMVHCLVPVPAPSPAPTPTHHHVQQNLAPQQSCLEGVPLPRQTPQPQQLPQLQQPQQPQLRMQHSIGHTTAFAPQDQSPQMQQSSASPCATLPDTPNSMSDSSSSDCSQSGVDLQSQQPIEPVQPSVISFPATPPSQSTEIPADEFRSEISACAFCGENFDIRTGLTTNCCQRGVHDTCFSQVWGVLPPNAERCTLCKQEGPMLSQEPPTKRQKT